MDCLTVLDELIESSKFLRDYVVSFGVLLTQKRIDVLDELHSNYLVSKLIVELVEVPCELEVKDYRVSILGFDEKTIFYVDVY